MIGDIAPEDNSLEDNVQEQNEQVNKENLVVEETTDDEPVGNKFSLIKAKGPSSVDSDSEGCNVHVVARVRPLNLQEIERKDQVVAQYPGNGSIWLDNHGNTKSFGFHGIFQPGCSQSLLFENCGMQHLLNMALDGYACTAFAFGQTGSGKTYTMTGPVTPEMDSKLTQERSLRDSDCFGLIQYSFDYLMNRINIDDEKIYNIKASYLEIYNEQVQDLLNPSAYEAVQVRWSKSLGFYVENLFVREIESLDDLLSVLEDGMKNRAVAEHNMNEHSSRSHSILTVYLDSDTAGEDSISITKHGKVSFVDLAGSEKVKETGSTGETLIEATNINRSLLTLGNCISALSDPKKRSGHIPFRDSKLTKLLADGLGGSGVTLMIACVSPSNYNLSETLNTLRYAKRARKIKNKPVVRVDPREELILKLQKEMNLLRHENRFLREQLEFPQREKPRFPLPNTADGYKKPNSVLPAVKTNSNQSNPDQSPDDNSLYGMLQEYMVENEALRNENHSLLTQHSFDEREHKIISRENDKLARKLEDLSRLMMSTPSYSSSVFFSRTNSGRSIQSFRTASSSLTPLMNNHVYKQPSYLQQNQFPNQQTNNGPMIAWNSTPTNGTLPPLRGPQQVAKKAVLANRNIPRGKGPPAKWVKATSYASQFQRRQVFNRPTHPNNKHMSSQQPDGDVMKDFPMRDFQTQRNGFLAPQNNLQYTEDSTPSGHASSLRDTNSGHQISPGFHVRFGKPFQPTQFNPTHQRLAVLPDEAYKPQDITPRNALAKELSATSLRKLNNRMRQEIGALDDEINSYKQLNTQSNTKKKIAAT